MSDSAKQFLTSFTPPPLCFNHMFFREMSPGISLRKLPLITVKCFAIKYQQLPRHAVLNSGLEMNILNSETATAHLNISTEIIYLSQDSKLFEVGLYNKDINQGQASQKQLAGIKFFIIWYILINYLPIKTEYCIYLKSTMNSNYLH